MEEVWKQIEGAKEGYKISNKARCVNPNGRILKPYVLNKKQQKETWSYRYINAMEAYCNPAIYSIMAINFPDVDISSIHNGRYAPIRKVPHKGLAIEDIVSKIKLNTTKSNAKINALIIDFLEKGDHRFAPIVNECHTTFSNIARVRFEKLKKSIYNTNVNRRKTDISETHEDILQEFYIKLMRLLKEGYFDGRKFFSWTMRVITNCVNQFFGNHEKYGVKVDKDPRKTRGKRTKEENLRARKRTREKCDAKAAASLYKRQRTYKNNKLEAFLERMSFYCFVG